MEHQEPGIAARLDVVAWREIPRVCVIDAKQSTRTFMTEALEELGFTVFECRRAAELEPMLASNRPDLVVIGSSAGGIEACETMELLAARQFGGKVLVVGPRVSPMVSAIRRLGSNLGLAMLPLLPTPFGNADLGACIAPLLPSETPLVAPSEPHRAGPHELRYRPRIDTRRLALGAVEAVDGLRLDAPASAQPTDRVASALQMIAGAVEDWRYFAARQGHVEIVVGLPAAFFLHPDAADALCRQMPDHPAFEGLIVGIDAAQVIRHLGLMRSVAKRLRRRNIAISIDGLGTEWPSLLGLRELPFVELKVDPRVIAGCADDRRQQATCRRILELADAMGARTVADGVASRADFLAVREMGFHQAQGPLFAEPLTAQELARVLPARDVVIPK